MRKKILWMVVSCLMVAALLLASCAPAAEPTVPAKPEGPRYGGHLKYTYARDATALDPIMGHGGDDAFYFRAMMNPIVDADEELVSVPALAESWEFPDANTMLFHLRKGVKFHDGTDFNAEVVKFNIERLQGEPKALPQDAFMVIEEVEIVDDYTVKFHLKNSWGAGLAMIAERGGFMSSPTAVKKLGEEYTFNIVGTGPFKLDEYVTGSHCHMVKNEDYWEKDTAGNPLPYLDELSIVIIPDLAVVAAAIEAGDVHLGIIDPKDVEKFEANPDTSVVSFEGAIIWSLVAFNMGMPPFDNVNLRRAVCYALNPEPVIEAVHFGTAQVADAGMWPPGCWVYDNTVPRPYYDPEKAKEFLKLGGKPNGFEFSACVRNESYEIKQAEMYQAQLAEIGIKCNIDVMETITWIGKMFTSHEYPAMYNGWNRYPEPDWMASSLYKSDGYYNLAGEVPNAEMDDLIERAASSYDFEERKAVYRQINEIVLDECWCVPLIYGPRYTALQSVIGGMDTLMCFDAKPRFTRLWLKE